MKRNIIFCALLAFFMGMAYGQEIPPAPANCTEQAQKLIDYARALGNFETTEWAAATATQKSQFAMHVRSFNKNRYKFFKDCSPNLSLIAELNNKICMSAKTELQKMAQYRVLCEDAELAASSVIKSIEHAQQALNKLSPAEVAENNPSRFYKTADINQLLTYCARFEVGSNDATITPLIAKIETEGYSHVWVFSANVCPPKKLDPSKYSTPMIQYVADDSDNRYNFPNEIYKYLEKHGDKSGWLQVINAKNSKGMTYLDYVKYVYKKTKNDELKPRLLQLYEFACNHGGEFSYYNNQHCGKSIED